MTWLDGLLFRDRRSLSRAEALLRAQRFDDALETLGELATAEASPLRAEARRQGAHKFLAAAVDACRSGQGTAMRQHLARAQRYRTRELEERYLEAEREIRTIRVRHAIADHWVELLDRAGGWGARHRAEGLPPSFRVFGSPSLLEAARRRWSAASGPPGGAATAPAGPPAPLAVADILGASREQLQRLRPLLADQYPDDLAGTLPGLGPEFVRAVLLIAAERPDLAALPLMELAESDPLVCFERARVAHSLGAPETTLVALQSFASLLGGHRTIRRLNTGVFAAQVAAGLGDLDRAIRALESVPVRLLGRRPVLLYGRLLVDVGRLDVARDLLADHLSRHPDNTDCAVLLEEVRERLTASDFEGNVEITTEELVEQPLYSDDDGGPVTAGGRTPPGAR